MIKLSFCILNVMLFLLLQQQNHIFLPGLHFLWILADVSHSIISNSTSVMILTFHIPVLVDEDHFYQKERIYPVNNLLLQMMLFTNRWNGILHVNTPNFIIANA